MRNINRIVECSEPYYSQIHLANKPNNQGFRFCIDYRRLNEATTNISWPLPLIDKMLQRVGAAKPKYFATIDMTAGYHQIAMDSVSQKYTAFITFLGIFQWLCIPFGLKGAPAYFQKLMSTVVLVGLIYVILELYIDDIIIYASNEADFIQNIQRVFERFRQFNLKLSPKKCVFGATELECVGRIINEKGVSFSSKKREYVVDFVLPTTHKELKKFIGIATHFSSHIRNYSMISKPLNDLIRVYKNQELH